MVFLSKLFTRTRTPRSLAFLYTRTLSRCLASNATKKHRKKSKKRDTSKLPNTEIVCDMMSESEYNEYIDTNEQHNKQFAHLFNVSLEDKIVQLSQIIIRSGGKIAPVFSILSAYVIGQVSWFVFGFIEYPLEFHYCMTTIPLTIITLQWICFHISMRKTFLKMHFYIKESSFSDKFYPHMIKLMSIKREKSESTEDKTVLIDIPIDISLKENLMTSKMKSENISLINVYEKQVQNYRRFMVGSCMFSMAGIFAMCYLNLYGDPMIESFEMMEMVGYSLFPLTCFASSSIYHFLGLVPFSKVKDEVLSELEDELFDEQEILGEKYDTEL